MALLRSRSRWPPFGSGPILTDDTCTQLSSCPQKRAPRACPWHEQGAASTAIAALGPRFRGGDGKGGLGTICMVRTTRRKRQCGSESELPSLRRRFFGNCRSRLLARQYDAGPRQKAPGNSQTDRLGPNSAPTSTGGYGTLGAGDTAVATGLAQIPASTASRAAATLSMDRAIASLPAATALWSRVMPPSVTGPAPIRVSIAGYPGATITGERSGKRQPGGYSDAPRRRPRR